MIGQPFSDTASLAHNAQVLAHYATAATTGEDKAVAFFFHRLQFFVSLLFFPTMADNGLRYWMQRHNELHLCLLTFLSDILPPARCRLDMPILQSFHISDCQSRKTGKDEHQPCQFRLAVIHFHCRKFSNFTLLQEAYLLFFFLILGMLKRIAANNPLADRTEHQPAQPAEIVVDGRSL